jgi:hypothetical protein
VMQLTAAATPPPAQSSLPSSSVRRYRASFDCSMYRRRWSEMIRSGLDIEYDVLMARHTVNAS